MSMNSLIPLAVARRTVCELLHFIFGDQPVAQSLLVRGRLVERVEHLGFRPQVFFRRVVAFETPAHVETLFAPGNVHLRDGTVAGGAANSLRDMYAVIEIHE